MSSHLRHVVEIHDSIQIFLNNTFLGGTRQTLHSKEREKERSESRKESEKVIQGTESESRKDGNVGGTKRTCFFLVLFVRP